MSTALASEWMRKRRKAKQYAEEKDRRVRFLAFQVEIQGNNGVHMVEFQRGTWVCDCDFFRLNKQCAHTMTMEYILGEMLGY